MKHKDIKSILITRVNTGKKEELAYYSKLNNSDSAKTVRELLDNYLIEQKKKHL